MELIDIKIEWTAIFDVGDVGAAHGSELDLGDEESAENAGVVFADEAFREVDDEDFAFVHDFSDVETGFRLANDVADDGVGSEGADFVENWGDGLVDLFFVPLAEFVFPELEDGDVFTIFEGFFAEIFVGEHAGDIEEGGFWAVEKGEEGVAEDMLEARTPRIAKHAFQDTDDFRTDIGFSRLVGEFERVESDWVGGISWVEIDDVFDAAFGDKTEVVDGKVAVGIDDAIALIIIDVGESEKFEEAALPCAGLTNDVDVARAVAAGEAELVVDAAEISEAEGRDVFVVGWVAGENREL